MHGFIKGGGQHASKIKQKDFSFDLDALPKVLPVVATGFAVAFDIGYFYSIDIGWFSFFTLSEHVEFALRALPIAIAVTVIFLFVFFLADVTNALRPIKVELSKSISPFRRRMQIISHENALIILVISIVVVPTTVAVYYLPKIVVFFHDQTGVVIGLITWVITSVIAYHLLCCSHRYRIFKTLWIAGLFSSGVYVGACLGYFVLASSICALAIGTFIYCQIARPGKSIKTIFIAINLMVFTFFAGFITTKEWYLEARYDHKLSAVSLADGTFVKGQVMHPGAAGLLFYQHADAENSREAGVRLFRWDQVKAVELCKAKMECKDETKHKVLYIYE